MTPDPFHDRADSTRHPAQLPSQTGYFAALCLCFLLADFALTLLNGKFLLNWAVDYIWTTLRHGTNNVTTAVMPDSAGAAEGGKPWPIFLQPTYLLVFGSFIVYDNRERWRTFARCQFLPRWHRFYYGDNVPGTGGISLARYAGGVALAIASLMFLLACGAAISGAGTTGGWLLLLSIVLGLSVDLVFLNEPIAERLVPPDAPLTDENAQISHFVTLLPELPYGALYAVEPMVYVVEFNKLRSVQFIRGGQGELLYRPRQSPWYVFVANRTVLGREDIPPCDSSLLRSKWRAVFTTRTPDPALLNQPLNINMPNVLQLTEVRSILERHQTTFNDHIQSPTGMQSGLPRPSQTYSEIEAEARDIDRNFGDIKAKLETSAQDFQKELTDYHEKLRTEQEHWLAQAKARGSISPNELEIQMALVDTLMQTALSEINSRDISFDRTAPRRMVDALRNSSRIADLKAATPPVSFDYLMTMPKVFGNTLQSEWYEHTKEVLALNFHLQELEISPALLSRLGAIADGLVKQWEEINQSKKDIVEDLKSHTADSKGNLKDQVKAHNEQVDKEIERRRQAELDEERRKQADHDRLIAEENLRLEAARIQADLDKEREKVRAKIHIAEQEVKGKALIAGITSGNPALVEKLTGSQVKVLPSNLAPAIQNELSLITDAVELGYVMKRLDADLGADWPNLTEKEIRRALLSARTDFSNIP